jgi:ATP-binding cassette subfamily F protein 3
VSHDRYLLRATVDSFVLVHSARAEEFDGDLDDYLAWLQKGGVPAASVDADAPATEDATPRIDRREERRIAAERRQRLALRLKPIEAELAGVERELPRVEQRIAEIEQALGDPDVYRDNRRATELSRERAALGREREALEARWLALADDVESIRAADAAA